jgi:hemolysin activation/secretion protein
VPKLLQQLQLLQLDPLIETISADLQAGTRPGTSLLQVGVKEADSFSTTLTLNNGRSPSVGTFRRQIEVSEANLLGWGDGLSIGYSNTNGSNGFDLRYSLPVNPRNGTVKLGFSSTTSNVLEEPFDVLDIKSTSRYYEMTFRQPLFQSLTQEFAMGLTFARQESQTELGIDDIGPFPLSPGADNEGRTKVSSLRFFQEYTQRSSKHVLAMRSQFNFGLDWFGATVNENAPDSRFLSWRGQGQWVRLLAPDTLLLVRGDLQLTGDKLLPLEQFGLGGQESVRGYRQDSLLTDNGLLFSAEVRIPVFKAPRIDGVLQVAPFFDLGSAWNNEADNPDPSLLMGVGLGVIWRQGKNFSARFDWGIPLRSIEGEKRSLQEQGLYFSLNYTLF